MDLDGIHSKGKNKLYDEKAVFGCVCRHEFPLCFLDIKHGERLVVNEIYPIKCIDTVLGLKNMF